MRIVHIITRLILGGAQENTLLTCLEQARLGHEVTLLTGPPLGPEGSLLDAARIMPFRTVLVPALRRAIRPWHDLEAYADLGKHLRDIHPDVVHTHSSKAGILGRLAARRTGAACIVHTIHGLPFDEYQPDAVRWTYRVRRAARGPLVAPADRRLQRHGRPGGGGRPGPPRGDRRRLQRHGRRRACGRVRVSATRSAAGGARGRRNSCF